MLPRQSINALPGFPMLLRVMFLRLTMTLLVLTASSFAVERSHARSMVITRDGIVATSHVQASVAGAKILERGGSAVDAAIAANATLGVTEPMMNGMGGDLFAICWEAKTGKLYGLNASGWAPRELTIEHLKAKGATSMPQSGIDSVTVPGAVAGWHALHQRFGRLAWKDLFQSAISYAEDGYPVPELIASFWEGSLDRISEDPEARRIYLPGGKPPVLGQVFQNPDLAKALRLVAQDGVDAFYKGEIARAVVSTSQSLGGTMAADDLADFSPEWVEPISSTYRGWTVYELPPNGQGMAALEMLNIMETTPASTFGFSSPQEMHERIEAMKLAYSDLRRYDADPRTYDVPLNVLLSKEYARKRAALIDPAKANCDVPPGQPIAGDTTYLTVVDKDGNIASWIQSVSSSFGSGVTVEGMGFALQNRGANFTLDPKHPNVLAGGKRSLHTIIPAYMEKGDQHVGFGIMGGFNQPLAHAQFVSNIVDYGMNLQAALEAPRFTKLNATGCDVSIEMRVPAQTLQQLSEAGHQIRIRREYTQEMGRGQAIMHDSKTGVNFAASDPRADGSAVPEPIR